MGGRCEHGGGAATGSQHRGPSGRIGGCLGVVQLGALAGAGGDQGVRESIGWPSSAARTPTSARSLGGFVAATGCNDMLGADMALAVRIERAECRLLAYCVATAERRRQDSGAFVQKLAGGVATYTGPDRPFNKVAGVQRQGLELLYTPAVLVREP